MITGWPLNSIDLYCVVLEVPEGEDVNDFISRLKQDPRAKIVSTMNSYETRAVPQYADALVSLQSGLHAVNAVQTHAHVRGENVSIAVIDTEVSPTHPDLSSQIRVSRDFVEAGPRTAVGEPHGTAMAAIIAADGSNGVGIVGVAPAANILALRGCWEDASGGRCNSFTLARALNFAIAQKADVINFSLSGAPDPLLSTLIDRAVEGGAFVVGARSSATDPGFQAQHDAVFSAHVDGERGGSDSLALPGDDIVSAHPERGYDFFSGSSVAAAHLSGVAALLKAADAGLESDTARSALRRASERSSGDIILDSCVAVSFPSGIRCE